MKLLRYGSRGPETAALQLALGRAGLAPGPADGVFGGRTLAAVQRFQKNAGLDPDGAVGPAVWEALSPWLLGFRRHTARRGDTFLRLAREAGSSPEALAAANPGVPPRNVPVGQPLTVPFGFAVTPASVPVTAALCETVCAGIAARYPAVRPGSAGRSALGRRLSLLSLGTGPARVFFNAVHHANEWITAWLVLTFFEEYARAAALGLPFAGQSAAALAARTTLTVLPLVDPDGADLVTGALSDGPAFDAARAAAEAYPAIPFPDGWKANALGTDLNLNYPAGWETARDIKFAEGFVSPAPRDFVGEAPLSAPESRAVAALSRGADFSLSVSFHTQGEVIYWRYGGREPAGSARIARRLAEVSGYALDDAPYRSSFAGYKDWFIETFDRPGFTVEAGLGRNPLPLSDFPGLYARVKPLMLAALNEA